MDTTASSTQSDFMRARSEWYRLGVMISLLVLAAANAVSYFFRSEEWGDLLGRFQRNWA